MAYENQLGALSGLMKRILFLCSGNYYRSRFAEILFNHLAQEKNLAWRADSRGLVAKWSLNPGPISEATLEGLAARNILYSGARYPLQLDEADLLSADRIIALYETEHRAMIRARHPQWEKKIDFWHVPDLGEMSAEQALTLMERNVRNLLDELHDIERWERMFANSQAKSQRRVFNG